MADPKHSTITCPPELSNLALITKTEMLILDIAVENMILPISHYFNYSQD